MDRTIRFPEVEDLPESGNKTINFVHNQQLFWCLQDSRCWIKAPKRESPGVRVSKRIFRVVLLPSYNFLTRWPTLASGGKSSSWDLKWQRWIREICPWEVAVSPARSPPRWPQPSQLIHPRAGDSGQRDRLGPERPPRMESEICRHQPQRAPASPPMAALDRGWRPQPRPSGEGGRTRKSQSRFERQLRHSFTRIVSGLLITFVPAIRPSPPCPPPFSLATLFKAKAGSTRWVGCSSTGGLYQTT